MRKEKRPRIISTSSHNLISHYLAHTQSRIWRRLQSLLLQVSPYSYLLSSLSSSAIISQYVAARNAISLINQLTKNPIRDIGIIAKATTANNNHSMLPHLLSYYIHLSPSIYCGGKRKSQCKTPAPL